MEAPDTPTVLLWEAGPTGQLYALPAGDGVLPGFKLIGVAVLNASQLAVAQDVAAALLTETELDPPSSERTWPGPFLD